MNKYILLIGIIMLGIFTGCDDFLQEEPKANLAGNTFYKSAGDIELAVNAVIQKTLSGNCIGDRQLKVISLGDDITTTQPASNKIDYRELDRFGASPGNWRIELIWKEVYEVVYQANAVMENYGNAEGDQAEIEAIVSVARFYRALHYFEAVRIWGDVPLITSTVVDLELTRSPSTEVYQLIIDDLTEAIKWLPESQPFSQRAYPTIWAAKTLLADVYLTMAGWPLKQADKYEMAKNLLKDVKDNSPAVLLDNYADLFEYKPDGSNEPNAEAIFSFVKSHKNDVGTRSYSNLQGIPYVDPRFAGWADIILEVGFMKRFPKDDRFDATFITMDGPRLQPQTIPWQEFHMHHPTLAKFRDGWDIPGEDRVRSGKDIMYYRYADVLLMYAEAATMADGSPSAEAYQAINDVRLRAHGTELTPGLDQIAFRDSVIEEVAWEFAGEARRWFDLVRTERVEWANDLSRKYKEDYTDGDGNTFVIEDMRPWNAISKERYLMPIPGSEILQNPGLTQNEAYK